MALTRPRAYQIYDIDYKQSVRVVTVSNITLSGGAPNAVDGVNLSLNDRILVTGQSSGAQNGIYYVTTLGSGANGTWTRSVDTDATGELLSGTIVMVTEGTTYADTQWKLTTNDPITIGSTALTFVQNYLANSISYGSTAFAISTTNANATISVAGTSNVAVYATTGEYITGIISASGNITAAGNISGTYVLGNGSQLTGLPATYANTNVAAYLASGTDSSNIITTANVTGGNILTSGIVSAASYIGSVVSVTANVTGGNLVTVGAVSTTGNAYVGNILTNGYYYANGAVFGGGGGGGTPAGANTQVQFNNNGVFGASAAFTFNNSTNAIATSGTFSATGNVTGGNILTGGLISATGNVTGGNLLTGGLISATGNVTGGNLISTGTITVAGNIVSSGANAVANIGSATTYFNTVHAKATSAQYADVAEYYASDANYEPGTVVVFGGEAEVTISTQLGDSSVAGVVSTNPAYIMNAGIKSEYAVPVALTGRVPTKVIGPVKKGNMMISSGNGYAQACSTPAVGTVIGKAIENFEGTTGVIEIVVGRV